jgi:hypothetical protein
LAILAALAVKDDLRSLANQRETYYTDHQHFPGRRTVTYDGARGVEIGNEAVRLNRGDRLAALQLTPKRNSYCLHVVRITGASDTTAP